MLQRLGGGGGGGGGAMASSSSFSLFFPLPSKGQCPAVAVAVEEPCGDDHSTVTTSPSSPTPSSSSTGSVDCTLSLGTPSSRRADRPEDPMMRVAAPASAAEAYYCQQQGRAVPTARAAAVFGHDPILDRRCANCGTSSTPLWRNGPRGPKSLCNACGIRFKKEERRAAATAESGAGAGAQPQRAHVAAAARAHHRAVSYSYGEEAAPPCGEVDADQAAAAPFQLAWRLNVVPPAYSAWPERAGVSFQY